MPYILTMLRISIVASAMAISSGAMGNSRLPEGFIRLADIAPEIHQDIRYAGPHNFTGNPVSGYARPVCILARPAADALKRVQALLVARGFSLAVFDCYRPRQAVAAFLRWAKAPAKPSEINFYLPSIARTDVLRLGYVASRSSHSRGIAVDVTIVRMEAGAVSSPPVPAIRGSPCNSGGAGQDLPGALDMGTRFDCFDEMSHIAKCKIPRQPAAAIR